MTASLDQVDGRSGTDEVLVELIERLTAKITAGEPIDVDEITAEHPQQAEQLCQLLPAMYVLADLDGTADAKRRVSKSAETHRGTLGDYEIVREIGRGGMGVVYEAEQVSLGRRVALKVLPFAAVLDERQLQRFKNEAQAAATLMHQNIVPVHSVGCERGVHYYAMQFIEGQTLAEVISEIRASERQKAEPAPGSADGAPQKASDTPASDTSPIAGLSTVDATRQPAFFRTVARLGIQVAEALDYAHQHGVVHRDIKPSNLLLDYAGNLWVTDFGLALVETDPGLTMTGDILGTLRYMSPEQALAKRMVIDHRTDIYSLGVTLYELLTLRPAFPGRDRQELLKQIAFEDPQRPSKINPAVPPDLETILLKATAKIPEERYATAKELAEDLERFLGDKPIHARRPTVAQVVSKWSRRHRGIVRAVAATLVVAATIAGALLWRERSQTLAALVRAEANFSEAGRQREQAEANFRKASEAVEEYYTLVSQAKLLREPRLAPLRKELLGAAIRYYDELLEQHGSDHALEAEIAAAYIRIAVITFHQESAEWLRYYERGLDILERLVRDGVNLAQFPCLANGMRQGINPLNQGNINNRWGAFDHYSGEAFNTRLRARNLFERLVDQYPTVPGFQSDLARNYYVLGDTHPSRAEALNYLQMSAEIYERLDREHPSFPLIPSHQSDVYRVLAYFPSEPADILRYRQKALRAAQREADRYPNHFMALGVLAHLYKKVSNTQLQMGRLAEALDSAKQAVAIVETLYRDYYPNVARYQLGVAGYRRYLGKVLAAAGRPDEAAEEWRLALEMVDRVLEPSVEQSKAYFERGKIYVLLGQYERAISEWQKVVDLGAGNPEVHNDVAWQLATNPNLKIRDADRAVELATKAVEMLPSRGGYWNTLGVAHYRAGDWEAAIGALEKSNETPSDYDGGIDFLFVAMAHWQLRNRDEARKSYDKAVHWYAENPAIEPQEIRFRAEAAELLGIADEETSDEVAAAGEDDES